MNFENKVGIVTGSGRGIGKATAMRLASDGASGVVIVDLVRERLKSFLVVRKDLRLSVLTVRWRIGRTTRSATAASKSSRWPRRLRTRRL